jgi:hypothetical protein
MSLTLTAIDDRYQANQGDTKRMWFTGSLTNPYTASGESVGTNTYFPKYFLGGAVTAVHPSSGIDLQGIMATGKFRADANSVASTAALAPVLQFFNAGLAGTAKAGLFVDNTTANLSNGTFLCYMEGR